MAGAGNPDNLRRAAQAKRQAATRRAEQGLRKLIKTGQPVTFEAVAQAGGVSKDFLYRSPLRSRIEGLRERTGAAPVPPPPAVTPAASDTSSVIRTLTAQLAELRRAHRQEVAELHQALAAAHGQLLELRRRLPPSA